MNPGRILVALTALALIGACSDSTQPDGTTGDVQGLVVDARGVPVPDATVVLEYATDASVPGSADKPSTVIDFELVEPGPATLWIGSYCDADTVRMLLDGTLPAGQHTLAWNGADDADRELPDGVYWYHLVTATREIRHAFVLLHHGYSGFTADAAPAPLVVTDARGRFALGQGCLPFDHINDLTDEAGNVIGTFTLTRRVRVWAFGGTVGMSDWVTVDPQRGVAVTVRLGK